MLDDWRSFLYFSLGFLPSIFFVLRFLFQWIRSEKEKKSVVDSLFWRLSISGNILLALHYFIQFQYQFLLIQAVNAFISWRNLNFIKSRGQAFSFKYSISILFGILGFTFLACFLQNVWTSHDFRLLEAPMGLSKWRDDISILWHVFGFFSALLFASRFWIQWLQAEKNKVSELTKSFWVLSIFGSISALLYFFKIRDWSGIVSYSFGLIPYIRNLSLILNKDKTFKALSDA